MLNPTAPVQLESSFDDERYSHPAYGVISMSVVTGGDGILTASDFRHQQRIVLSVNQAEMAFSHGRRRMVKNNRPVIEFEMSHSQFSRLVTSPNVGEGVPCTLRSVPTGLPEDVPGILRVENANDEHRRNIKRAAEEGMAKIMKEIESLKELAASGSIPKKRLNDIIHTLECHSSNLPKNLSFSVEQAERALDTATDEAKSEIECYIENASIRAGLKTIGQQNSEIKELSSE